MRKKNNVVACYHVSPQTGITRSVSGGEASIARNLSTRAAADSAALAAVRNGYSGVNVVEV